MRTISLCSVITILIKAVPGQKLCPFQLYIWEGGDGCNGPYTSKTLVYADGRCRTDDAPGGPGTYTAQCSSDGSKLLIPQSGCLQENCGVSNTESDGSDVCLRNMTSTASLYSALDSPALPFDPPDPVFDTNLNSQVLHGNCLIIRSEEPYNNVSFVLFGSCNDFSCGSSDFETSDAKTVDAPATQQEDAATALTVQSGTTARTASAATGLLVLLVAAIFA